MRVEDLVLLTVDGVVVVVVEEDFMKITGRNQGEVGLQIPNSHEDLNHLQHLLLKFPLLVPHPRLCLSPQPIQHFRRVQGRFLVLRFPQHLVHMHQSHGIPLADLHRMEALSNGSIPNTLLQN